MSKFAAALKEKTGSSVSIASKPESKAAISDRSKAREGAKHVGGYFTPEVSKQLLSLAVMEDSTVQDLLAEALNLLFQSRRLPMIAAISREQATTLTSYRESERTNRDNK